MDSVHDEQNMTSVGLLHSDIPGSKLDCSSPRLFAAYHVLHRLSMPRHPSCALSSLTTRKIKISLCSQLSFFFCGNFFKTLLFFDCQSTPRIHRGSMKTSFEVSSTSCRFELVGVLGFEPRTSSLSGTRSNQLSYTPGRFLVELTGIEPATYSLQSYRSSQLSYSPGRRSYPVFLHFFQSTSEVSTSCCSNSESCDATLQKLLSATSGRLSVRSLAITGSLVADHLVRDRFAP